MSVYIAKDNPEKKRLIKETLSLWRPSIDVENIVFLPGGSTSVAVRAGEFVCRFPQTSSAFIAMRHEAELTGILKKNLSESACPKMAEVFIAESPDEKLSSFSYHRYIDGKIMDNIRGETEFNTCYTGLESERQNGLALEIASFFADLHALPMTLFQTLSSSEYGPEWDFTQKIDAEKSRKLLLEHSGGKLDLNEFKTYCPDDIAFCHNDLSGSNMLVTPEKETVLAGIIDFANAGLYPRTNEFIPLYKIGRDLVCRVVGYYNRFSKQPVEMKAVDYKFLCFLCFLLEQQEKPSRFATALISDFIRSYCTQRT